MMLKQDQFINQQLKKKLFQEKGEYVKGNSINNLVITSSHPIIIYSYLDAFLTQNKVEFRLISIKINTDKGQREVIKQIIDIDPFTRLSAKDFDSIEFKIQKSCNTNELHLVEVKASRGEKVKSSFYLFYLSLEIINDKQRPLLKQIVARKQIKKVNWHSFELNIIVALTQNAFVLFNVEQDIDEVIQIPFKQLSIKQQITDFCFWKQKGKNERQYMSCLSVAGKTYIMAVNPNNAYSFDLAHVLGGYNQLNWTGLNIVKAQYNKKLILLSIKSGFAYKNNKKETVLQVHHLRKDQKSKFHQHLIVQAKGSVKTEFYSSFQIIKSSLFYFYDNQLMRFDLSKPFNAITTNENGLSQSEVEVQLIVNMSNCEIRFVHISNDFLMTLRRKDKQFVFNTVETDILECFSEEELIRSKIEKINAQVERQINKKNMIGLADPLDVVPKPTYLVEEPTEANIEKFLSQVNTFIQDSQNAIATEQTQIAQLYHQINQLSKQFSSLTHKKYEVEALQEKIYQNEKIIREIEEASAHEKTNEEEKAEQIEHMIDHVRNRPIEIDQTTKKEFSLTIKKQLQVAKGLENRLTQWEGELKDLL